MVTAGEGLSERVREIAPDGVNHVVEPAFADNIADDCEVLSPGRSIATYASGAAEPGMPFWPLVFKNIAVHFLGSDDFALHTKITQAHERLENPVRRGRVVIVVLRACRGAGRMRLRCGRRIPVTGALSCPEA